MDEQFARRRAAVAALARSVLDRLSTDDGQPHIGRTIDNRRWWRRGQEDFVGLQPCAWTMPPAVPIHGWLDSFAEMKPVREAYGADPRLGYRVDTMIGVEFNRQDRIFGWLLIEYVITPMVLATGTYDYDVAVFDRVYDDFERGFGAEQIHMIEFLALNGFESNESVILLPDGLVLQRMSDTQMSAAIDHLAVPRMSGGSVNGARVSRFDQWALMTARAYPVADGRPIDNPRPPAFPTLYEPAIALITALRIVCGGSVVSTRSMFAQAHTEFPIVLGASAVLTAFDSADNDRPTYLLTDKLDDFRTTYTALGLPDVKADRTLQTAIRRLVFAGSRSADADRLLDLMMAAEALFIKRADPSGRTITKGDKVADAAAVLLDSDPHLNATADAIRAFMTTTSRARNAEVHGDGQPYAHLHLLDGTPTNSMPLFLGDAEKIMRRAVYAVLAEYTASHEATPAHAIDRLRKLGLDVTVGTASIRQRPKRTRPIITRAQTSRSRTSFRR